MKYALITFGCKVNQYESSAVGTALREAGFEPCGSPEDADIVIINSCSVTENGDKKARRAVRAAKRGGAITVLTGCYPQAFPEEAAACGADIVCGTASRAKIPGLIREYLERGSAHADLTLPREYEELPCAVTDDRTRAFIKIEDGCDRYCSYCVIPYTRGRVRSRPLPAIAEEARLCAENGHKEVVLVGINLSRYGSDTGCGLADAVSAASEPAGIVRVRLSSLEPELIDEETAERLAACPKLCPHFHLSLQSGCDSTLKRMNRHYDTAEYMRMTERLRARFPDCAITTDIMVGFAGETDEEFAESLRFAETAGFARIHVFTYSIRKGTAAEKRTDHIPEAVRAERYAAMSATADRVYERFLRENTGRIFDILIQKRTSPDYAAGLAPNYLPVRIYGSEAKRHDIVRVRITGAGDGFCTGEEIKGQA
ncbi:MAG: tRNA (N(6)-L-threonylcarbamoyladenosine(37)-C(2))-methylthiotransferase MtaB [Ruminiclostridium sp.]|nr:tRNA (N(6)-L-threonylcarbamoyladenosine(37)-C(2))-methylthiotransferase MtaB [Ruminiclostridium sp.]